MSKPMFKQDRSRPRTLSRRNMLRATAAAAVAPTLWLEGEHSSHAAESADDPRFLIVFAADGGASIIDSALAIRASESANAATLNTFEDSLVHTVRDSPFRAVDLDRNDLGSISVPVQTQQSEFIRNHHRDMMVATWTRTSVNHAIGQRRSVTGNEAWAGRSLQELAALTYGEQVPIPNVHLGGAGGFGARGTDESLPSWCFGETVSEPALWPLSLDGMRGLSRDLPRDLVSEARALRNDVLDPSSDFAKVFGESRRLQHWQSLRGEPQQRLESSGLLEKLLVFGHSEDYPIESYGLATNPESTRLREVFPNLDNDPFETQAAMAYLMLEHRVATTVTLGPSSDFIARGDLDIDFYGDSEMPADDAAQFAAGDIINPPLAFDFSHQAHRSTQAFMWDRVYKAADGLIRLLKAREFRNGESFWDRTMIVIASDFGRSKKRPEGAREFGTAHDLNNGMVVLSPMVAGNRVLGGVDPDTAMTYGFDPLSGEPRPGRTMTEPEIFAGLLQALGVDTTEAGLPDMPSMRRIRA